MTLGLDGNPALGAKLERRPVHFDVPRGDAGCQGLIPHLFAEGKDFGENTEENGVDSPCVARLHGKGRTVDKFEVNARLGKVLLHLRRVEGTAGADGKGEYFLAAYDGQPPSHGGSRDNGGSPVFQRREGNRPPPS